MEMVGGRNSALLETAEGKRVWSARNLSPVVTASGKAVVVSFSRAILPRQDYLIKLTGAAPDGVAGPAGTYYFRVALK